MQRRNFIKKTMAGSAATILAPTILPSNVFGQTHANKKINIGQIGCGRIARDHDMPGVMQYDSARLIAVCDVDSNRAQDAKTLVQSYYAKKTGSDKAVDVKVYGDYRELLMNPDIDAVVISTPDHWHSQPAIEAALAGKDVYLQKPTSLTLEEGRILVDIIKKKGTILQVGTQQRAMPQFRIAAELVRNGRIGKIHTVKVGLPGDPAGPEAAEMPIPSNLNYDMWLGPANNRPYNEKKGHYNWHWHWATGNGDTGNQGPHQFDVARWGLNKNEHPIKIQSMGGIYGVSPSECSQETPNTQLSAFEYTDGKILEFETRGRYTPGENSLQSKIGNTFFGTEGYLELNGSTWKAFREKEKEPFAGSGMAEGAAVGGDSSFRKAPDSSGHFGNFINAIRSGKQTDLNCNIKEGHYSTVLPLIANIAYRTGETLKFNGEFEQFIDNEAADLMLTRKYRYPYIVPQNV